MAHTYVTELVGGLPSARGSKYSYIYESRLEDEEEPTKMREAGRIANGQNGTERENRQRNGRIPEMENDERNGEEEEGEEEQKKLEEEMEERQVGEEIITGEDGIERHCTSTQKVKDEMPKYVSNLHIHSPVADNAGHQDHNNPIG
jgi:hypothetical protein